MLTNCESVDKIYLFIDQSQQHEFDAYFNNNKIVPVVCHGDGRVSRILRQSSEFWINRYYLRDKPNHYCRTLYRILNPDRRFLNKFKIDLLHIPRQHAPAYELNYPVVVTMHDIQHLHYPEFFTPLERIHKAIRYQVTMQEADQIIVSYNHVRNDLVKYFRTDTSKINICPVPVDNDWMTRQATEFEILKKRFKLPDVYILTPAATWEHKNHLAVLEALNILRGESFNVYWIATGHKTAFYSKIEKRIKELELENQVIFPGIVSDEDLRGLYQNASLVVVPTLYEAGSGPLIEAMRYEIPVICSNVTSLPDTIGDPEFIFNPLNSMDIAGLIKQGLTDVDFIKRNINNSRKQSDLIRKLDYKAAFIEAYSRATSNYKTRAL